MTQITFALRQAKVVLPSRKSAQMQVSEATFYRWKKKFKGMEVAEL